MLKVNCCATVRMHQQPASILLAQMYPLQDSFSITRKVSKPHKGKKIWGMQQGSTCDVRDLM